MEIFSRGNLFRDDSTFGGVGMLIGGCQTAPVLAFALLPSRMSSLRLHSEDDRIEAFTEGIFAIGGLRTFASGSAPSGCSLDLTLQNTYIQARQRGLIMYGALPSEHAMPGDHNEIRVLMRGVEVNAPNLNLIGDQGFCIQGGTICYSSLPNYPQYAGPGNRIEIIGNRQAYESANDAGDPLPPPELFGND